MTPEEEIDKIGEEMGQLNVEYDEKFEAIRSMIPKDAPKVQTAEDLKKRTEFDLEAAPRQELVSFGSETNQWQYRVTTSNASRSLEHTI